MLSEGQIREQTELYYDFFLNQDDENLKPYVEMLKVLINEICIGERTTASAASAEQEGLLIEQYIEYIEPPIRQFIQFEVAQDLNARASAIREARENDPNFQLDPHESDLAFNAEVRQQRINDDSNQQIGDFMDMCYGVAVDYFESRRQEAASRQSTPAKGLRPGG